MRTSLIAGVLGLIVVMIFVIQNAHAVNISFLGAHLRLSLAVALFLPPSRVPWSWRPPEPRGSPSCGGSCDATGAARRPPEPAS